MESYKLQLCKIVSKVIELNKQGYCVKIEIESTEIWIWHYKDLNDYNIINYTFILGVNNVNEYYKLHEFLKGVSAYEHT